MEPVEHAPRVVAQPWSSVGDAHFDLTRAQADLDDHPPARRCVADGVGQQVAEHLPDAHPVDVDRDAAAAAVLTRLADGDLARRRRCFDSRHGVLDEDADRHSLTVQGQLTGLAQRERPQVLDEPRQRVGLVAQQLQVGVVTGMDAVELRLDLCLQHRQRRAQFVGHVGEEATPRLLGRVEAPGHVVEGGAQRAHGPRSGRADSCRVLTLPDTLCAVQQLADRSGQPAVGDERGHEGRADDSEQHRR